jgi:hypothetical protein
MGISCSSNNNKKEMMINLLITFPLVFFLFFIGGRCQSARVG